MSSRIITPPPAWNCPVCSNAMQIAHKTSRGADYRMWHCETCGHRETQEGLVTKEKERATKTDTTD